ncbi:MAG: endonuclease [Bacilli bacterium]|nr:endonuclease [Bacilli bacterium]
MIKNKTRLTITLLASLILVPATIFVSFNQNIKETGASVGNYSTNPATYYNSVNGLSGNSLLFGLHDLMISTHQTYTSYDDNGSNLYQTNTDRDPNNSNNIIAWYSQASISKTWNGTYNREHVWPKSLSNGLYVESGAGADMHHIRPTIVAINSARGNKLFGNVSASYSTITYGAGNLVSKYSTADNIFEPHNEVKGDAARIIMYMYVHYNSSKALGNGSTIESYTGTMPITNVIKAPTTSAAWDLLLDWNQIDPVDVLETNRNNQVAIYQGNRNPFIDNPDYASSIWGTDVAPTSLSLSPSNMSLTIGATQSITVSAQPSGASNTVTWSSSNNGIATVSSSGVVTAQNEGQATITATSTVNTSITATMSVTVTPPQPPTSISVSPTTLSLPMGNVSTLNVTSSPSGTSNSVTWATSNSSVALVSNGVVSGIALGNATITATSTVNSNLVATCSVTIVEASSITKVDNYQNITEGNYFITVDIGSKYYLPMQTGGFTNGNSTITAFTDVGSINITNAWTFTGNGTNSWKISNNGYFLNSTTTNDGIGATASGISDYWVASQGSTSIMLKSNAGTRFLTAALSLSPSEWRGYGSANTNGTSNLILYRLGSGSSVPPTLESEEWAADFLNQTSLGCQNKSSVQLASVWNSVKTNYLAISEAAKMIISTATPNAFGSDVENALARYIDIVSKYDLEAFMSGVQTQSNSFPTPMIAEENMVFLLVFLAIIFLAGTMIFALTRKSKKH